MLNKPAIIKYSNKSGSATVAFGPDKIERTGPMGWCVDCFTDVLLNQCKLNGNVNTYKLQSGEMTTIINLDTGLCTSDYTDPGSLMFLNKVEGKLTERINANKV